MAWEHSSYRGEQMRVRNERGPGDTGRHRPWQGARSPGPVYGGRLSKERTGSVRPEPGAAPGAAVAAAGRVSAPAPGDAAFPPASRVHLRDAEP